MRYTKQVRAGVSSLAKFHKHEGRGYINDRVGAYEQPPRNWFKILNFRSWLDEGPPANYGNDSLGRIINHFASVVDQKTKANALVEWPILKTYLLARRKNHEGKLKSFHDVYIQLIIHNQSRRNIECPCYCGSDDNNFLLHCWL